jgi:polysaccharide biosynthesis transport protein
MKDSADRTAEDAREQVDRAMAFGRRMLRFFWVLGATVLVGALACAVFFLVKKPVYRSETVLLYSEPIRTAADAAEAAANPRNTALRLEELLLSRSQLEKLVQRFDLYPDRVHEYGMVDGVTEFKKHIQFRAPGGDTFSVAFEGTSAEQAQQVTASLAETLIHEDTRLKSQQAKVTRDFLDIERKRTEKELRDTELKLAEFMAKHPRFALDAVMMQPGTPVTGAAIRASMGQPSVAPTPQPRFFYQRPVERRSSTAQDRPSATAEAQSARPVDAQAARRASEERVRAEASLAAARTDLAAKQAQFTDAHPDVREARGAVDTAQARLAALGAPTEATAASRPQATEGSAPPAAQPRVAQGTWRPRERERGTDARPGPRSEADLVQLETDWATLTRAVNEARQRHDHIDAAFFKADMASSENGRDAPQISIVDAAFLPLRPNPPGRLTIAAIFLGLSLLLGAALMAVAATIDDRICDARDASQLGELLAEVPRTLKGRKAHAAAT